MEQVRARLERLLTKAEVSALRGEGLLAEVAKYGVASAAVLSVVGAVFWVVTSLLLAIASIGIFQLNAVGLQNKDAFYGTPESVVGEQVLARHFPA